MPPILDELELELSEETPQNQNSFIHALLDQFKFDAEYADSNLTVEDIRECVSASVFCEENQDLYPVLNYERNELLDPESWNEIMQISENGIYCDSPFIQMAANWFNRNIVLIPVLQKDCQEKDKNVDQNDDHDDDQNDDQVKDDESIITKNSLTFLMRAEESLSLCYISQMVNLDHSAISKVSFLNLKMAN